MEISELFLIFATRLEKYNEVDGMKAARIDDIFQVKCGVPIIADFYIGMEEDKAAELLEELTEYKTHHSCEYPADLIYNNKISFRYELFKESNRINMIEVSFPKGG